MKAYLSRWLSTLAFLIVLAALPGCNGIGSQLPVPGGQQLSFAEAKPLTVPMNTVVYVRLREPITSGTAKAGDDFTAVLEEPIAVDSQVAVAAGAEVGGKVVVAHGSGRLHAAGYVRITLSSINWNGKDVALQTNSAIAGGGRLGNRDLSIMTSGAHSFAAHSFAAEPGSSAVSAREEAGFAPNIKIGFRLTQPLRLE